MLIGDGARVTSVAGDVDEVLGTNTRADFAHVARVVRERIVDDLMDAGVTVIDPDTTYVDAGVRVGADTVLRPNTSLEGATTIGDGLRDRAVRPARRHDGRRRRRRDVRRRRRIEDRPGGRGRAVRVACVRGRCSRKGAKAGTFVEMKDADVGEDAKVPHLSYMGDVRIGPRTNIGAGTITANYNPFELAPDGSTKHRTTIGDDAYIGRRTRSSSRPSALGRRCPDWRRVGGDP